MNNFVVILGGFYSTNGIDKVDLIGVMGFDMIYLQPIVINYFLNP
jgi:hypothetical protein